MGKARTTATKTAVTTTNNLSKKKQPNVASAGVAFLVAGGYTPLQQQQTTTGAPPPLHEFITTWPTRWEACQMMRDQKIMMKTTTTTTSFSTMSSSNNNNSKSQIMMGQQSSSNPIEMEKEDRNNNNAVNDDDIALVEEDKTNNDNNIETSSNAIKSLGEAKVNVELLLKLRSWIISIIESPSKPDVNSQETLRSLLMGIPLTSSALMTKSVPVQNMLSPEIEPTQLKSLEELEQCDWKMLVSVAKKQIQTVLDPFLEKHEMLTRVKKD